MNLFTAGLSGAILLAAGSAAFGQPAAQLTPDEIVKALSCPAGTATGANGECQAIGSSPPATPSSDPSVQYCAVPPAVPRPLIRTPDGDCVEAKDGTLGFDLGAAANRAAPTANPAPAARPPNSLASLGRTNPATAPAAALPAPSLDLLLTFDTDSAVLTDQGTANARVFAEALKRPELKQARFEIEGHTDASGSREHNLTLSQNRAEAVKAFLVSQGVERDRLTAVGYAFDHLAVPDQPLSRANRRVVARRMQ